jgi:hypothetical protein
MIASSDLLSTTRWAKDAARVSRSDGTLAQMRLQRIRI